MTVFAALFDFINALPESIKEKGVLSEIIQVATYYLPGFENGFGWIIPSIFGFIVGVIMWKVVEDNSVHN